MVIDNEKAYHIGASLKDAGKKCFAISLLNDSGVMYDILQRLDQELYEKMGFPENWRKITRYRKQ